MKRSIRLISILCLCVLLFLCVISCGMKNKTYSNSNWTVTFYENATVHWVYSDGATIDFQYEINDERTIIYLWGISEENPTHDNCAAAFDFEYGNRGKYIVIDSQRLYKN